MRDVLLPKARPAGDTQAYTLEEIRRGLSVLPEPAATIVATAAHTGVRKGELRGLRWEHFDGEQICVSHSIWRGHVQLPKTKCSMAAIPVISALAARLEAHRKQQGYPENGLIFSNEENKPMNLHKLAVNVIRPAFLNAGLKWHGWHAFRRGLATNLHRLGVPDKTIQAILRHSNVAVTQACYIKTAHTDAVKAMRSLDRANAKCATTVQPENENTATVQ